MKKNLGKNNGHIGISLAMFLFVFALTSGLAHAESTDEYTVFSGQTLTAGSSLNTLVPLNLDNVSSSKGGTIYLYPQQGVNSLSVSVNGSSCGTVTVGAITPVPFNCNNSVITTAILQGTANVSVTNNGVTTHILSATLSARYTETAPTFNTSGLATEAQLNANTTTILAGQTAMNASIQGRFNGVDSNLTAIKNETNQIYQTINSQSWMDQIATRVWASVTRTLTQLQQSIITLS